MRLSLSVPVLLVAFHAAACGGDDSVNPTNPDAGASAKSGDAATDGSKDGRAAEVGAGAGGDT